LDVWSNCTLPLTLLSPPTTAPFSSPTFFLPSPRPPAPVFLARSPPRFDPPKRVFPPSPRFDPWTPGKVYRLKATFPRSPFPRPVRRKKPHFPGFQRGVPVGPCSKRGPPRVSLTFSHLEQLRRLHFDLRTISPPPQYQHVFKSTPSRRVPLVPIFGPPFQGSHFIPQK